MLPNVPLSVQLLASHADVLRGSSRVSFVGKETRDEPLRTSAWEAMQLSTQAAQAQAVSCGDHNTELKIRRRRVSMTAGGSEKSCQITSGQPS